MTAEHPTTDGLKKPSRKPRIALFGGTFDPVHQGHLHLAKVARDALELDEVRWIPCWISPHKRDRLPAPGEDRLRMLELATGDLPWSVVDAIEISRGGASYSVETAHEMARRHPGARLFWIMGTDQWKVLPSWAKADELSELVEFIVFGRGEIPVARPGMRMHALHAEHPASATAIRAAVDKGETPRWLPPGVGDWIRKRGLYRCHSAPTSPRVMD